MNPETNSSFVTKVLLRQSIESVRLVIALFTITAAITKLLYDRFLPTLNDLNVVRWTIIALGCLFFVITFIRYKRSVVVTYFSFFLYLSTVFYVIAFVVINDFNPHAVTILILVLGASTVIFNNLFYYGVQCVIVINASVFAFMTTGLNNESVMSFLNLMMAVGVFGIVMAVRLKLIRSINESHANLEKLNVLSIVANKEGEIVFVSPSVQQLLGYQPEELMKEGWWHTHNLREGWISKEYILNYPNVIPKQIVSMETKVINKEGKTVWFNWANSLLPNGNYLGLALDITKFKS